MTSTTGWVAQLVARQKGSGDSAGGGENDDDEEQNDGGDVSTGSADGADGADGAAGSDGQDGAPGTDGQDGTDGVRGATAIQMPGPNFYPEGITHDAIEGQELLVFRPHP